jgi:hypothetical protein
MDYIYGYDEIVARFVADLIPAIRGRGFSACKTIGIIDDGGMLVAGLVYHNWDPPAETIEISGAALPGKQWMTRETLKRMYQYPFLGVRAQMVINRVAFEDKRQLRMLAAYGYTFYQIANGLGRGKDLVIATLTREDWEANKFNQRLKHHLGVEPPLEEAA